MKHTLRLRPYKESDADVILSWIKDEKAFRKWSADIYRDYPAVSSDINENYDECSRNGEFLGMTAIDEDGIEGHLIMRFLDKENEILRFGFIIVNDEKRGKGLGKEMINLALRYAFEILKAKKVTLGVFDNNKGAYYCYKSVGFEEVDVPVFDEYFIMGEEWKCIEMEISNER